MTFINRSLFKGPQCLIYTDNNGKLEVQSALIDELMTIQKDLVVVAIAGLYRTGKSYLLNRLAGKTSGEYIVIWLNMCSRLKVKVSQNV